MSSASRFLRTGLAIALGAAGCGSSGGTPAADGGDDAAGGLAVDVSAAFAPGTTLRDAYGGASLVVAADGTVAIAPGTAGVMLLERDGAAASAFSWANATVYYAIVDRFRNGDPANDGAYGRKKDGQMEVGTFHGGDWKGLAGQLDYLQSLGVTALWISPIVEQVHGWAAGGSGDFRHYGYHGYWALDFTRLEAAFGTLAELQAVVDGAHQRGMRVLVDVVMNHPGYATGADLLAWLPEVFVDEKGDAFKTFDQTMNTGLDKWNALVNYSSPGWKDWWSPLWIRAGFPGFHPGGNDDVTRQLSFLPDFITEGTTPADAPVLFMRKQDTGFVAQADFTVRQYLVKWHTDWVRQLGIDGFRCDTAKNVEMGSWKALKEAGLKALADWKAANPARKLDEAPFWMTGEVFPHGVLKDGYYGEGGFDSLINFDFQRELTSILQLAPRLAAGADDLEAIYARYAGAISPDPAFGILSYISSHDTRLTFDFFQHDAGRQQSAGTALLLAPGAVEIFYGDESGRQGGPALSDSVQATRSDMSFASPDAAILEHWRKLGTFRRKHAAVGGGTHKRLASPPGTYAFARTLGEDTVVVILTP